uniref:Uncharacterized protein n=1 Tax=Arundo donax TaxID=35708 RepID=A0A0A9EGK7_ARUDO
MHNLTWGWGPVLLLIMLMDWGFVPRSLFLKNNLADGYMCGRSWWRRRR